MSTTDNTTLHNALARIEELERDLDATLERERALAAHVERLKAQLSEHQHLMASGILYSYKDLAKHDLTKQAEALEVAAAVITGGMMTGEKSVNYLERVTKELRRQAEGASE